MNTVQISAGDPARLSGTVKWFNRSKGFGFIVPGDGMGDVFLPLAVLERSGFTEAPDGAGIVFDWVQGPKGRAASQIVKIDVTTAQRRPKPDDSSRGDDGGEDHQATEELDGVVKWYDPARGFGFVVPNNGGKDVFFHATTLRRSGLDGLEPGQAVRMKVVQAQRGHEAAWVELAHRPA